MKTPRLIEGISRYDVQMFLWCVNSRHHRLLSRCARVVSKTGDGYLQILLPLSIYVFYPTLGANMLLCALLGFALELPLYWILKNSFQRRRPPEALPSFSSVIKASDRFSFPSGHTAAACLLTTLMCLFFGAAASPLVIWAGAVGASRVLLGVHFPTDILAGAVLGSGIALLSYSVVVG